MSAENVKQKMHVDLRDLKPQKKKLRKQSRIRVKTLKWRMKKQSRLRK